MKVAIKLRKANRARICKEEAHLKLFFVDEIFDRFLSSLISYFLVGVEQSLVKFTTPSLGWNREPIQHAELQC